MLTRLALTPILLISLAGCGNTPRGSPVHSGAAAPAAQSRSQPTTTPGVDAEGRGSSPVEAARIESVAAAQARQSGTPTKTLVVVEENHSEGAALRSMPYLSSLAHTYGYTSAYRGVSHPSLPNYLAIVGGSTFGVRDDADPASHRVSGASALGRAVAAGKQARVYAEGSPGPCPQSASGRYAVKHDPWSYFSDPSERSACLRGDGAAGTPSGGRLRHDVDAGALPHVGMLIPDLCHDGHDCSLGTADTWLRGWLPRIMSGPDYRAGRLAIIVTFDEDDYSAGNTVLSVVISPYTSHVVSHTPYTHYSLARYLSEIAGTPPLREAARASSLRPAFHI